MTERVEYCNTFLGELFSLDPETAQSCSYAQGSQAASMGGMLLGGALAIIGITLVIVGVIQGGREKDLSEKPVQTSLSPSQKEQRQQFQTSSNDADTIYCRYCGELRPRKDESCALCGRKSISSSTVMKRCAVCEVSTSEDSVFCANCGAKFQPFVKDSVTSTAPIA